MPVANVSYSRIIHKKKWKLEVKPPESFFINSSATCLDDARVFGFRQIMRKYEAVEMGLDPDDIKELPLTTDTGMFGTERDARLGYVQDEADEVAGDPMAGEILVCEAWIKIDIDDDGFAEFLYVITAGDQHKVMHQYGAEQDEQIFSHGMLRMMRQRFTALQQMEQARLFSETTDI